MYLCNITLTQQIRQGGALLPGRTGLSRRSGVNADPGANLSVSSPSDDAQLVGARFDGPSSSNCGRQLCFIDGYGSAGTAGAVQRVPPLAHVRLEQLRFIG